jgi:ABC-type lipoprotein release transport system permease subunit
MLKLAWRNIWRNKRRTLITTASIFFGVVLSAFISSMQEGSYELYIRTVVNFYSGYIQIHQKGYWDDKTINNTLLFANVQPKLQQVKGIIQSCPRLESFALAAFEDATKGVMIIGVDAPREDAITNLSKRMVNGQFLTAADSGVMLGSALAKYLKLTPGDTLVLLSQGYHGASAAGKYPVRGILRQPSPDLDRMVVYMDVAMCQELFSATDRLTSVVIMVDNDNETATVKSQLTAQLGSGYDVMDWKEMNHLLLKTIESDRSSNMITKGILYMIIAFGILGTVMMMTVERRKEFSVLMAIGMPKHKLSTILMLETILMGAVGVIAGIGAAIPITWYFTFHPILFTGQAAETFLQMGFEPIMPFSMTPSVYYRQAITIFIFAFVIGWYPVVSVIRLKINKALRG